MRFVPSRYLITASIRVLGAGKIRITRVEIDHIFINPSIREDGAVRVISVEELGSVGVSAYDGVSGGDNCDKALFELSIFGGGEMACVAEGLELFDEEIPCFICVAFEVNEKVEGLFWHFGEDGLIFFDKRFERVEVQVFECVLVSVARVMLDDEVAVNLIYIGFYAYAAGSKSRVERSIAFVIVMGVASERYAVAKTFDGERVECVALAAVA